MTTTILLDTHVALWLVIDPDRIDPDFVAHIQAPGCQLLVSAASVWEIAIKTSLGKLDFPAAISQVLTDTGFRLTPVTAADAEAVQSLPWHHRDPFDRLLLAQAIRRQHTLATRDRALEQYEADLLVV